MKRTFPAAVAMALLFVSTNGAQAIDCKKAASRVERATCADPGLLKADAAMGAAYAKLLKESPDAEIKAALVFSQKRWIEARDKFFGREEDSISRKLLAVMKDRTKTLQARTKAGEAALIDSALEQRRFASQYTGGPFAGFSTSCEIVPSRDGKEIYYNCSSVYQMQNHNRVCSTEEGMASYSGYTIHRVADVVDGKPKMVAACSYGSREPTCPDDDALSDPEHWNMNPGSDDDGGSHTEKIRSEGLQKLDGEAAVDDSPWFSACLTNPSFPKPAH